MVLEIQEKQESDKAARIKDDFMFDQTVTPMIFITRQKRTRDMLMTYQLKTEDNQAVVLSTVFLLGYKTFITNPTKGRQGKMIHKK